MHQYRRLRLLPAQDLAVDTANHKDTDQNDGRAEPQDRENVALRQAGRENHAADPGPAIEPIFATDVAQPVPFAR